MSYIGEKEVVEINSNVVTFTDGSTKSYTDKALKYMVTDEPKDLTQIQNLVLDNVCFDIFEVLEQHDIKKGDIGAILNTIVSSFNETFNTAVGKAFGTYEQNIHSANFVDNIRLSDIKRVKNI